MLLHGGVPVHMKNCKQATVWLYAGMPLPPVARLPAGGLVGLLQAGGKGMAGVAKWRVMAVCKVRAGQRARVRAWVRARVRAKA